jgi:hypothetical protein
MTVHRMQDQDTEERIPMIITAKILDPTHLELSQPIPAQLGECIRISILSEDEEDRLWQEAAKEHFLDAYDDEDAIYDKLSILNSH